MTQLNLPANDISGLTMLLPRRNYESAQSHHLKMNSSISKANSYNHAAASTAIKDEGKLLQN